MDRKVKIVLAPNAELAKTVDAIATVEAEYGDVCIEGKEITLAHHGSRSNNPAPCNTDITIDTIKEGTILVSHLDLDSVGGCLALMDMKLEDKDFWKAAEFIDVEGIHHIHELNQNIQDKLNAYYAWNNTQERKRYTEIADVTESVENNKEILDKILDERHPEHQTVIDQGKEWEQNETKAVEEKLVKETANVRAFITDGVFCAGSYYSPKSDDTKKATVTLNTKFNAITIAFEDGGKACSAVEIVQNLWGEQAGGRDGIAGSPRNWEISNGDIKKEFEKAIDIVDEKMKTLSLDSLLTQYESSKKRNEKYGDILKVNANLEKNDIVEQMEK